MADACRRGDATLINNLRSQGTSVTERPSTGPYAGDTYLHIAAENGRLHVVQYLLENGLTVHERGQSNRTVLHAAAKGGHKEVCEFLISCGVDATLKDRTGKNAYDVCNDIALRQYLLQFIFKRVDPSTMTAEQLSACHAMANGSGGQVMPPAHPMASQAPPGGGTSMLPNSYAPGNQPLLNSGMSAPQLGGTHAGRTQIGYTLSGKDAIVPDGFVSSANDPSLQGKYGHQYVQTPAVVPPPPTDDTVVSPTSYSANIQRGSVPTRYTPPEMSYFGNNNSQQTHSYVRNQVSPPPPSSMSVPQQKYTSIGFGALPPATSGSAQLPQVQTPTQPTSHQIKQVQSQAKTVELQNSEWSNSGSLTSTNGNGNRISPSAGKSNVGFAPVIAGAAPVAMGGAPLASTSAGNFVGGGFNTPPLNNSNNGRTNLSQSTAGNGSGMNVMEKAANGNNVMPQTLQTAAQNGPASLFGNQQNATHGIFQGDVSTTRGIHTNSSNSFSSVSLADTPPIMGAAPNPVIAAMDKLEVLFGEQQASSEENAAFYIDIVSSCGNVEKSRFTVLCPCTELDTLQIVSIKDAVSRLLHCDKKRMVCKFSDPDGEDLELEDEWRGSDFGLEDGTEIDLEIVTDVSMECDSPHIPHPPTPEPPSPPRQTIEENIQKLSLSAAQDDTSVKRPPSLVRQASDERLIFENSFLPMMSHGDGLSATAASSEDLYDLCKEVRDGEKMKNAEINTGLGRGLSMGSDDFARLRCDSVNSDSIHETFKGMFGDGSEEDAAMLLYNPRGGDQSSGIDLFDELPLFNEKSTAETVEKLMPKKVESPRKERKLLPEKVEKLKKVEKAMTNKVEKPVKEEKKLPKKVEKAMINKVEKPVKEEEKLSPKKVEKSRKVENPKKTEKLTTESETANTDSKEHPATKEIKLNTEKKRAATKIEKLKLLKTPKTSSKRKAAFATKTPSPNKSSNDNMAKTPSTPGERDALEWLQSLELDHLYPTLAAEGFDTLARLSHLDADDLDHLKIKRGHRKHLLASLASLQAEKVSRTPPSPPLSQVTSSVSKELRYESPSRAVTSASKLRRPKSRLKPPVKHRIRGKK
eukprot:g4697.t1